MAATADARKAVEFYTIELAQLVDGAFRVSITATTVDDEEPQLLSQELVTERMPSMTDVLSLIARTITN